MRTGFRAVLLAFGLVGATMSAAHAEELRYFYCYVPDPASGTVFMSPAMPIGPMGERGGYGAEFAAYLRRAGQVSDARQGYCAMRPSQEAIARAQAALPRESCPECAGATRFEGVAWQRNGATVPAPAPVVVANHDAVGEVRQSAAEPAPAERYLLVMGNTRTGKLLALGNRPTREAAGALEARFPAKAGWKTLLLTSEPGFGAAVCAREAGETRFFVAHAQDSLQEAVQMARDFALQNAIDHSAVELCGSPWEAGPGIEEPQSVGDAMIETIKGWVRGQVVCNPAREDCPAIPRTRLDAPGKRG